MRGREPRFPSMPKRSRVELHPLTAADRGDFVAAMLASRKLHRPWISPPTTGEAFDAMLERTLGERTDCTLARRREDGAIVGYFNLSQIIRGPLQSAFLGYGGVAAHARQGT